MPIKSTFFQDNLQPLHLDKNIAGGRLKSGKLDFMAEQNITQKYAAAAAAAPPSPPPDWTIGELYSRSWEIIKKYKVLWLFGMVMAGAAASGLENSRWDALIPSDSEETPTETDPEVISEGLYQGGQVLSTSTQAGLGDQLQQLLSDIPTYLYILGGIEVVLLVLTGWAVLFVYGSWANASLIEGIQTALAGGNVSIRDSSEKAFRSIKPLVWLAIVPTLILILASSIIFPILAIPLIVPTTNLFIIGGLTIKVLGVFVLAIAVLIWIVVVIFLTLAQIWAPREVVIDKKPAKDAFFAGLRIARRKFWSMLLLGLVNTILTMVVVGIPVGIMVGFLAGGFLTFEKIPNVGIGLFATGGILLLAFVILGQLFGGIIIAFKSSVWTIAYNNIRGKYDK